MTPLVPVQRSASSAFLQRAALMAKPPEFFQHVFGGRLPTFEEKALWIEKQVQYLTSLPLYTNDLYVVVVERQDPFFRLSIHRHDRQPCREWRHLQQIKNEICGTAHEAVELFPAEERLLDTNNEYHLWVHADPSYRFPLGFQTSRCVVPETAELSDSVMQFTPAAAEGNIALGAG